MFNNKISTMKEKTILNTIKKVLGMEVKLEQMKLENGTLVEAESFEPNAEIFVVSEDERIPIPMGEYKLEDGRVLVIAEDGILAEIKSGEEAPMEEEAAQEEVKADEVEALPKKVVDSISKETFFSSEIEKLNARIDALELANTPKEVVEEVKEEVELKVETIKHSPEAVVEKKQKSFSSQNQVRSTKGRIYNQLFSKN